MGFGWWWERWFSQFLQPSRQSKLITGRPPCTGKTLIEKVTRIRQTAPEKPTKFQMSIPSMFEGVVVKLLAKEPKDRYQTAAELLKELERVGKFSGVTA